MIECKNVSIALFAYDKDTYIHARARHRATTLAASSLITVRAPALYCCVIYQLRVEWRVAASTLGSHLIDANASPTRLAVIFFVAAQLQTSRYHPVYN